MIATPLSLCRDFEKNTRKQAAHLGHSTSRHSEVLAAFMELCWLSPHCATPAVSPPRRKYRSWRRCACVVSSSSWKLCSCSESPPALRPATQVIVNNTARPLEQAKIMSSTIGKGPFMGGNMSSRLARVTAGGALGENWQRQTGLDSAAQGVHAEQSAELARLNQWVLDQKIAGRLAALKAGEGAGQ